MAAASWVGWKALRAFIRYGWVGVELGRRLSAARVREVDGDDAAARAARPREVLLRHQRDVPGWDARRANRALGRPGRVVDEVGLRLGDAVVAALDPASGDEDRIPRLGHAHRVVRGSRHRPRVA